MAGLSVLLETHKNHSSSMKPPQIICKATLHSHPRIFSSSPATAATTMTSFLQRCFLCHKELADGKDIYMYRGDRAFCSVDCRCRQIFMDEDAAAAAVSNCSAGATAVRAGRRRTAVPREQTGGRTCGAGGFAY